MDFRTDKENIYIGDFKCPITKFLEMESKFKSPDGDELHYIKDGLRAIITNGNQHGDETYNWGDIDSFIAKKDIYTAILDSEKPAKVISKDERRRIEYVKRGAYIEKMTVLMWEKMQGVDNSVEMDSIEAIRNDIKDKIK